jgi:nuclear receptor subfamily 4 group A protein 2
VDSFQMKIIDALRDHCTYNSEAQKKPHLLSRILGRIPELRSLSSLATQRLDLLRATVPAPPALATFF